MVITPAEAKAYVKYQLGALMAFTMSCGEEIQHVKPHGALYNMAAKDFNLAKAMAEAVYETNKNIIFLGLSGSEMIRAAKEVGICSASEVFADRAYNSDGSLVARGQEGAIIHDEDICVQRVIRMVIGIFNGFSTVLSQELVVIHIFLPITLLNILLQNLCNIQANLLQSHKEQGHKDSVSHKLCTSCIFLYDPSILAIAP